MTTTSSEHRLHPLSVVFDTARTLPRTLLPLVVLLFARWDDGLVFILTPMIIISGVILGAYILRYLRFTYRYDARDLVIRSGVFIRNERSIPYTRIQNLDAAQNPLQRLLGVTAVYVQTGAGAEPEASLRVLPVSALEEMRARVLAAGGRASGVPAGGAEIDSAPDPAADVTAEPAATRRVLLELSPRELLLAGFIENRGMVLILGAFALLEQVIPDGRMADILASGAARVPGTASLGDASVGAIALYVTAALLLVLLFVRLLSTVWAVVRLYGFRLERVGDDLHTEYGLFTRVSATIPLRRIQTVIVRDGLLHRMLGLRVVDIVTAGGAATAESGAPVREPIAPILRIERLRALLHELQPGFDPDSIAWRPVHQRAFGRILRGSLAFPIVITLLAYIAVQEWALLLMAVLVVRALFNARLRSRNLAWSLLDDAIVVRDGALTRKVRTATFNRVQVASVDRGPIDLRMGMAHVRADTAGVRGGVRVPYLTESDAAELHEELVARTAVTAFTW